MPLVKRESNPSLYLFVQSIVNLSLSIRVAGASRPPMLRAGETARLEIIAVPQLLYHETTALKWHFPQPGSPATGFRRWGGRKCHPARCQKGHVNCGTALEGDLDGSLEDSGATTVGG